ncbi:MAG TPA: peptide chain release factor N(5)-glutamine methyltransferase [Candidatus Babeliales bacterium]|nr:peptide chain release factor N(5)-glutamine methyltransferase [Candidatus Babeliales bacterium]
MEKTTQISSLITDIEQQILTVYNDPILCRQYAWWTVEAITNKRKTELINQDTIILSEEQQKNLNEWLEDLITKQMPIQYLLGSVPFCDVTILVAPPTLIPRPETEEWCFNLITKLKKLRNQQITILDLCCGSGCIAITLAQALPHATIYACDIADSAIALSKKNSAHNKTSNLIILHSDLFNALPKDIRFDLIVTNPPYITPIEWQTLDQSVAQWEDKGALVADDDGLALIKKIIAVAPQYLQQNEELQAQAIPQLMIEIGYLQGPTVATLMQQADYTDIKIDTDLEHKDRVVSGRTDNVAPTKAAQ